MNVQITVTGDHLQLKHTYSNFPSYVAALMAECEDGYQELKTAHGKVVITIEEAAPR